MSSANSNRPFCAVCIADIIGPVRREPIGPDDAMVAVCDRCATERVKAPRSASCGRIASNSTRTDEHRERRKRYEAAGLCVKGPRHGAATHGKVCEACWRRNAKRSRRAA